MILTALWLAPLAGFASHRTSIAHFPSLRQNARRVSGYRYLGRDEAVALVVLPAARPI